MKLHEEIKSLCDMADNDRCLTQHQARRDLPNFLVDHARKIASLLEAGDALKEMVEKSSLIEVDAVTVKMTGGHPIFVKDGRMLVHKHNMEREMEKTQMLQKMAGMARKMAGTARKIADLENKLASVTGEKS